MANDEEEPAIPDPDNPGDPGPGFPGDPGPYPLDPVTVTPDPDPTPPTPVDPGPTADPTDPLPPDSPFGDDPSGGWGGSTAPVAPTTIIKSNLQPCAQALLTSLVNLKGNDIGGLFRFFNSTPYTTWNLQSAFIPNDSQLTPAMLKPTLLLFISIFLLCAESCCAQYWAQSSIQPLPSFPRRAYVVIPSDGFTATHVKTKRLGRKGEEFLDLINVFLPESYVIKQLAASKDLGFTGLHIHDGLLVTMAVLPDLASGRVTWVPIQLDTVPRTRQVAWEAVASDCYARLFNYEALGGPEMDWSRRRLDIHPVLKRGNQYVTTNQSVLTEYFVLRDRPTWYPTTGDNAIINCLARIFTPLDYTKELTSISAGTLPGKSASRLRGELGNKLLLQKAEGNIYTFWSLAPNIADGNVAQFGAGDLRYQPEIGLIGGKYASYFSLPDGSEYNKFFDLIEAQPLSSKK